MTVHPAALVLADHQFIGRPNSNYPGHCSCNSDETGEPLSPDPWAGWRGLACDHPAHLAEVLDRAGLLAAGTPPETPTTRVRGARMVHMFDMPADASSSDPRWQRGFNAGCDMQPPASLEPVYVSGWMHGCRGRCHPVPR